MIDLQTLEEALEIEWRSATGRYTDYKTAKQKAAKAVDTDLVLRQYRAGNEARFVAEAFGVLRNMIDHDRQHGGL